MAGKKGASGGARKGTGPKLKYGEETERLTFQVPKSHVQKVKDMIKKYLKPLEVKKNQDKK